MGNGVKKMPETERNRRRLDMKKRYKYLGAGMAVGVMLMLLSGPVLANDKDGPGMADGRSLLPEEG